MRQTLATFALAVVTAGLLVVPTTPAAAAPSCPRASFCIYNGFNRSGTRWSWVGDDLNYADNGSANDKASSVWNHGIPDDFDRVWVFEDALNGPTQGGGLLVCLNLGEWVNFRGAFAFANNKASAHNWSFTC
jgi:hypothetical protein